MYAEEYRGLDLWLPSDANECLIADTGSVQYIWGTSDTVFGL